MKAIGDLLLTSKDQQLTWQRVYFECVPMPGNYVATYKEDVVRRVTIRPFPGNPYTFAYPGAQAPADVDDDEYMAFLWSGVLQPPQMIGVMTVSKWLPKSAMMVLRNIDTNVEMKMTVNSTWCYWK